jgi:uncharacterized membrane protein YoaK (UPF0700 family)
MSDAAPPVARFAGTLPLVTALAAVAGCLDAVSLARITHTFVAFQTGNLVLVGLGAGRGHWSAAALPAVSVLAYLAGSALVPALLARSAADPKTPVRVLLSISTALLFVEVIVVAVVCGLGSAADAPGRALRFVCIVLSALAMAFQTPVVRSVRGVPVSTTFSTGMLTRLGQALGVLGRHEVRTHEGNVVLVIGATVVAFLAGATLGGVLLEPLGNGAIVVPCAGLLIATVLAARGPAR